MRVLTIILCLTAFSALYAEETESYRNATELSSSFRAAAERVLPATVKIISRLVPDTERPKEAKDARLPGDTAGTGVLINSRGIVLTNNHVIDKAREIVVELPDGRKFFAKKYRHDPETDLAMVWLDMLEDDDDLPFAEFGNSDTMDIGDWVLAIGNPFDLDSTVSAGIVSAKGRVLKQVRRTEFLQTDASINPGNSGGPLINLKGEVIGINTAIVSQGGMNQGISFALPSNNARWIVGQILEKGKVERAWIGLETLPVTPWVAKRLNVKPNVGVLVDYPVPGSPADEATLQHDDVILSFDDQAVNAVYQLHRLTERAEIGKPHRIVLIRDGKRYAAEIDVKPMPPAAKPVSRSSSNPVVQFKDDALGILVIQPPEQAFQDPRMGGHRGMIIWATIPKGRAEKAGIPRGALITKINGQAVASQESYVKARAATPASGIITLDVIPSGEAPRQFEVDLKSD